VIGIGPDACAASAWWLSVDQAVRLTGEPERTWSWRAKREATQARKQGRESLAIKATHDGRVRWMIHRSLDDRLASDRKCNANCTATALLGHFSFLCTEPQASACAISRWSIRIPGENERYTISRNAPENHPQHFVARGLERNRWLQRWLEACAKREDGLTDSALAARVVNEAKRDDATLKISVRSLYLWRSKAHRAGGVAGLVDKYTGPGERAHRSAEAVEYFYSLYHTENKLSAAWCHRCTRREAQRRGWEWPETEAATRAWLKRHDDLAFSYLMRYGKSAWSNRYMPHLTMDWGAIPPGHMYVADHKQCDFWAQWKGGLVRPWLTAVMDCRSRLIVGTHLGPAPHTESILCAFAAAFRDHGLPNVMKLDNGKDFTSRAITGYSKAERARLQAALKLPDDAFNEFVDKRAHDIALDKRWDGMLTALDIDLKLARPYEPWSKPIERWFGTFNEQCAKLFATWCGDKPQDRPEALAELKEGKLAKDANGLTFHDMSMVPTMLEAADVIAGYLAEYHGTPHSGIGCDGRTPIDVWNTGPVTRRVDDETLALMIGVRGAYKVGANGVKLKVGGATSTYGRRCQPLWRYRGRKVLVSVDPVKPQHAYAIDADTKRFIATLEPDERIHPDATTDDVREAIAEDKRDQSIMHKARRSSARRTRTMVQRINEQKRALESERKATGTHGPIGPSITQITGFEGASKAIRSTVEPPVPGPYDHISLDDLIASIPDEPQEPEEPRGSSVWHLMAEKIARDKAIDDPYANVDTSNMSPLPNPYANLPPHDQEWFPEDSEETDGEE